MSVIKSKRNESAVEYINTARTLRAFTIRQCVKFPKRYTFYISSPMVNSATRIHQCCQSANDIYPTNRHEVQVRRDYLMRAYVELRGLAQQIEVASEVFGIDFKVMRDWAALIDKEIRLVKAMLKSDRERYKNIE